MNTSLAPEFGKFTPNSIMRSNSANPDDRESWTLCPTLEAGAELQFAYHVFNEGLFGGKLPNCLITYTRRPNVLGHFCPDRYQKVDGELWPELAMNPTWLALRDDLESLSTLVHEMAHVERHYHGPLNRKGGRGVGGYHDRQWGAIMKRVGLHPSDTGQPGGKETGYGMSHYIVEGGPFEVLARKLIDNGFKITWTDNIRPRGMAAGGGEPGTDGKTPTVKSKKQRRKFTCPECRLYAWAKESARLTCTACAAPMRADDPANASKKNLKELTNDR